MDWGSGNKQMQTDERHKQSSLNSNSIEDQKIALINRKLKRVVKGSLMEKFWQDQLKEINEQRVKI